MNFGFRFDFMLMCIKIELELHELHIYSILYSLGWRGDGSYQMWLKCSFTMHIRFCMRSLIGANAKPSRLKFAMD